MSRTPRAAPDRRTRLTAAALRLQVAVPVSLALVAIGVVVATAPASAERWWTALVGPATVFVAILLTGAAITAHRRR